MIGMSINKTKVTASDCDGWELVRGQPASSGPAALDITR